MVSKNKSNWDQKLDSALWELRNAFEGARRATPFRLVYGLEAIVPMEFVVPTLKVALVNKLSHLRNHCQTNSLNF